MESGDISSKIDQLVSELKKSLLNAPYNSRGFFDKVKNWWQNITKGSNNPSNPYYFQNKFGSLGKSTELHDLEQEPVKQEKSADPDEGFHLGISKNESRITLKEYAFLSESFSNLDKNISSIVINENYSDNVKNLEMFRIIDNWAINFKKQILDMLNLKAPETQVKAKNSPDTLATPAAMGGSAPAKEMGSFINFSDWVSHEKNMEYFINLVNRIFDSAMYNKKQIKVISNNLKAQNIGVKGRSTVVKGGKKHDSLSLSVRNKIISILRNEIKQDKIDMSVFSKNVWVRFEKEARKKLPNISNESGESDESNTDSEGEAKGVGEPTLAAGDFDDFPGGI